MFFNSKNKIENVFLFHLLGIKCMRYLAGNIYILSTNSLAFDKLTQFTSFENCNNVQEEAVVVPTQTV